MKAIHGELYFRQRSYDRMLANEHKRVTKAPSAEDVIKRERMRKLEDNALAREYGLTVEDLLD